MRISQLPRQWRWGSGLRCWKYFGDKTRSGPQHKQEVFVRTQRSGDLEDRFESIPRVPSCGIDSDSPGSPCFPKARIFLKEFSRKPWFHSPISQVVRSKYNIPWSEQLSTCCRLQMTSLVKDSYQSPVNCLWESVMSLWCPPPTFLHSVSSWLFHGVSEY